MRPDAILQHLGCPVCRVPLDGRGGSTLTCDGCRREYPPNTDGRWDFRLRDADVVSCVRNYSPAGHARACRTAVRVEAASEPRRNRLTDGIPVHLTPIPGWDVVRAQIEMEAGSGSRGSRAVGRVASAPFAWALGLYGALGRRFARAKGRYERAALHARHAGAVFFVAQRPVGASAELWSERSNQVRREADV